VSQETTQPSTSRFAFVFIFVTMVVDSIGLGIIIPVGPKIIAELTHQDMSGAAEWGGWLFFVYALMQFIGAPVIGNLSDRFGRRPVLILSLLALGIDYLITGLAPTIFWLFVARFLSGLAGASYTTVNAYIAFSIGFVLGPAIGGTLGEYGPRVPFYFAAGLSLLNALFGLFVLKESLKPEYRRAFEIKRANPLGALNALKRLPGIFWIIMVFVLMRLAHDSNPSVFSFYVYAKFQWTPKMVGYSLMAVGVLMAIVYGGVIRVVIPKIGETASVYLGLASGAIGFAGYAFATESWEMFAFMVPFSLMAFVTPALSAILSKKVGPSEQGELQGALACIGSLTSIVSPPLLTNLFAYFSSGRAPVYFPGAAFLAASLFLVVAALVFTRMRAQDHELQPAV
jgi:DHA1 family tetracycline resistance protein-like MFS transporter